MSHHQALSPSKFPMLAKCPCFESGEAGEAAQEGSRQHEYLAAILTGSNESLPELSAEGTSQVEWAAERVRLQTGSGIMIEERLSLIGDDFEEITFGTADVVGVVNRGSGDKLVLMDYKSGEDHGYLPQMAVYARMAMFRFGKTLCEVHELYGRGQWDKHYDLSQSDTDFVMDIIASAQNPDRKPSLCEFCGWCSKQGKCTETAGAIVKVATEYEPESPVAKMPLSEVETWHASQITDPLQMSIVLDVANYIGKWADSVKAHAKEAAMSGMAIPGYVMKEGRTVRSFADISGAYQASGLDADEFLSCCSASVPDVEKAMAAKAGHKSEKAKAAKDAFDAAMGDIVVRKASAPQLVKG